MTKSRRWGWLLLAGTFAGACGQAAKGTDGGAGGDAAHAGSDDGVTSSGSGGEGDGVMRGGSGGEGGADQACGTGAADSACAQVCNTTDVCDRTNGRFLDCPVDLASYRPPCSLFGGLDVLAFDSKCGGTVIEVSDGVQTERWTFSSAGEVVGSAWNGDVGDKSCFGEPCAAVGTGRDLCVGEGGAGGAGGAGGQPALSEGGASGGH